MKSNKIPRPLPAAVDNADNGHPESKGRLDASVSTDREPYPAEVRSHVEKDDRQSGEWQNDSSHSRLNNSYSAQTDRVTPASGEASGVLEHSGRQSGEWRQNDWQDRQWKQKDWRESDWRQSDWQNSGWERRDWQADEARSSEWQDRLRAQEDGVLEAKQHTDGLWYVQLGPSVWKSVIYDFYCPHCDSEMSLACLSSHLSGDRHRRRLAAYKMCPPCIDYQQLTRGTSPTLSFGRPQTEDSEDDDSTPPLEPRPLISSLPPPHIQGLQKWQEIGAEGIKCIPCDKYCDGFHENTADHIRRVALFVEAHEDKYREPAEPWLAWLPCKECGEGRYLRCLLCKKWVQDFEGTDTRHYDGQHGKLSVKNQKGHMKKMENLDSYKQDYAFWNSLLAERSQWHPPAKGSLAALKESMATQPAAEVNLPASDAANLPEGWHAEWCPKWEQYYYYSEGNISQWERPTSPARLSRP